LTRNETPAATLSKMVQTLYKDVNRLQEINTHLKDALMALKIHNARRDVEERIKAEAGDREDLIRSLREKVEELEAHLKDAYEEQNSSLPLQTRDPL